MKRKIAILTALMAVLPLLQGAPKLVYENGLPRFAHLRKVRAK